MAGSLRRSRKVATDSTLRTAQIDRIEIELQPIEQRQSGRHHEPGADDDRDPLALHEPVDRRERLVSHLGRLARGLEQHQQCRDHGDAGQERDDHAEAGEQAELGETLVVGRQERQEAGRGGGGGERQRRAHVFRGVEQRRVQIVDLVALGAIAHAELDAEIDAETDEQDRERHRDQIERADQRQTDRESDREPDQQADEDRQNESTRSQRQPQDGQHHQDRAGGVDERPLLHGCVFLVGDRHRSGEPQSRAVLSGDVEIRRRLANGVGRLLARRQRAVIEHRPDLDETALLARCRRPAVEHRAPGEAGGRPAIASSIVSATMLSVLARSSSA